MLNLALYDQIRIRLKPPIQRLIADTFLRFDYRKLDLRAEGLERIPSGAVMFAMNHTDNFNYWPFQYLLHKRFRRYTATWVKGKNYEGRISSAFMRATNNIPIASKGYVITRDFLDTVGRPPTSDEYRVLRDAVDAGTPIVGQVPKALTRRSRDMLGRHFDAERESYVDAVESLMNELMKRFVDMNRRALDMGLDVLVFPQGSRSRRLSTGHIGLAQVALHLGATIVPVGCSGSDEVYTSRSILTKPGTVVYRVGEPLPASHWGERPDFIPFDRVDEERHRPTFERVMSEVMQRINELVDEPYRFSEGQKSEGTSGPDRFV